MFSPTMEEIQALEDTDLCRLAAERCEGYVVAGEFHGRLLMHPPGLRTAVVSPPDYTGDWNACMRLAVQARLSLDAPSPGVPWWTVWCGAPVSRVVPQDDAHGRAAHGLLRRVITEVATWVACQGQEVAR